jgi:N-acetylmuramate 1-kinase
MSTLNTVSPSAPSGTPVNSAQAPILWPDEVRRARFHAWLDRIAPQHGLQAESLRAASADASFRRYFRVDSKGATGQSYIVMDAPPPLEDVRPFISVAAQIANADLLAPRVLESDVEHGFLLLSDLGARLCLDVLQGAVASQDSATVNSLMRSAASTLVTWQQRIDASVLPPYSDALLNRDLSLFPDWCVARELGVQWTPEEQAVWQDAAKALVQSALAQATVAVHRDYMPRNLMLTADNAIGILDFQDAVRGPISYDVASLLRDAFISWDEGQEIDWAVRYWQQAKKAGLPVDADFGEFWRQVEWMGLQRHLKVLGIFCRLKHRDGKPKYSTDLPRFFNYAHKVAARYNSLRPLSRLLEPLMGAERRDVYY